MAIPTDENDPASEPPKQDGKYLAEEARARELRAENGAALKSAEMLQAAKGIRIGQDPLAKRKLASHLAAKKADEKGRRVGFNHPTPSDDPAPEAIQALEGDDTVSTAAPNAAPPKAKPLPRAKPLPNADATNDVTARDSDDNIEVIPDATPVASGDDTIITSDTPAATPIAATPIAATPIAAAPADDSKTLIIETDDVVTAPASVPAQAAPKAPEPPKPIYIDPHNLERPSRSVAKGETETTALLPNQMQFEARAAAQVSNDLAWTNQYAFMRPIDPKTMADITYVSRSNGKMPPDMKEGFLSKATGFIKTDPLKSRRDAYRKLLDKTEEEVAKDAQYYSLILSGDNARYYGCALMLLMRRQGMDVESSGIDMHGSHISVNPDTDNCVSISFGIKNNDPTRERALKRIASACAAMQSQQPGNPYFLRDIVEQCDRLNHGIFGRRYEEEGVISIKPSIVGMHEATGKLLIELKGTYKRWQNNTSKGNAILDNKDVVALITKEDDDEKLKKSASGQVIRVSRLRVGKLVTQDDQQVYTTDGMSAKQIEKGHGAILERLTQVADKKERILQKLNARQFYKALPKALEAASKQENDAYEAAKRRSAERKELIDAGFIDAADVPDPLVEWKKLRDRPNAEIIVLEHAPGEKKRIVEYRDLLLNEMALGFKPSDVDVSLVPVDEKAGTPKDMVIVLEGERAPMLAKLFKAALQARHIEYEVPPAVFDTTKKRKLDAEAIRLPVPEDNKQIYRWIGDMKRASTMLRNCHGSELFLSAFADSVKHANMLAERNLEISREISAYEKRRPQDYKPLTSYEPTVSGKAAAYDEKGRSLLLGVQADHYLPSFAEKQVHIGEKQFMPKGATHPRTRRTVAGMRFKQPGESEEQAIVQVHEANERLLDWLVHYVEREQQTLAEKEAQLDTAKREFRSMVKTKMIDAAEMLTNAGEKREELQRKEAGFKARGITQTTRTTPTPAAKPAPAAERNAQPGTPPTPGH